MKEDDIFRPASVIAILDERDVVRQSALRAGPEKHASLCQLTADDAGTVAWAVAPRSDALP